MKIFLVLLPLMVTPLALGFHTLGDSGEGNAATFSEKFRHAYTAATADQSKLDAVTQLEEMLMHRYSLVEVVKRIAKHEKLDAIEVEKEIACLVSDSRRATQIMVWCQDKNERPWRYGRSGSSLMTGLEGTIFPLWAGALPLRAGRGISGFADLEGAEISALP